MQSYRPTTGLTAPLYTVITNIIIHCYILLNHARSIVRKVDELKLLVHDENSDIIFITESWTAEHIGEAEIRGCNILDLVLSKTGDLVEDVEITEPLGIRVSLRYA